MLTGAFLLAAPGVAFAQQSIAITSPTGFPAGGDPTYTTTIVLDNSLGSSAGTPGLETITLAPGVLASLTANPSCLTSSPQYTSACQIGGGSASVLIGVPLSFNAYLVPPPSAADVAGIDLVIGLTNTVTHAAVQLVQNGTSISSVIQTDLSQLGAEASLISGMTLTVDGTLGGQPFSRMPTNCSPGSSTLSVVYTNGTTSKTETTAASPDFAPTGCASLPFAPQLSATATRDPSDQGAAVSTTETQASDEAASAATTLVLPWPTLVANLAALKLQNTSTSVGTATATSSLLPTPLTGQVFLIGTPLQPSLTIIFPPPVAMTLTGTVDLATHAVIFGNQPDVPLTSLVVSFPGGPQSLLTPACTDPTGTLKGMFTGQNGATATANVPLTIAGCPGPPTLTGSLSRVASGHPVLSFRANRGPNAPELGSLTVSLPRGISFKGLRRGISVSAAHRLRFSGGRLIITLKGGAASVTVNVGAASLRESRRLVRQARRHPRRLTVRISIADVDRTLTTRTVVS